MKSYFGMMAPPRGGFGNRVFAALNVRHIAKLVGANSFFQDPSLRPAIGRLHKNLPTFAQIFHRDTVTAGDSIREDFIGQLSGRLSQYRVVRVKGAMLGETFARYANCDSREFVNLKVKQCKAHRDLLAGRSLVTLHLRAGDFAKWNPEAILPATYYLDALSHLKGKIDGLAIRLCTDDSDHPALEAIHQHLRNREEWMAPVACKNPFMCDFAALTESEYLVSSPSTFSISAGFLGRSKVIQSRKWVENRVLRDEWFWKKVADHSLPGYSIEAIL